jgi:hypothetical protein
MGYAEPKSGNTMIKSVVGQSFVGTTQQSNTQVISGFLTDTLFRSISVDVRNQEQLPASYSLWQNYPNPFNPTTTISYQLPTQSHVTLKVFDVLGREVATLANDVKQPGEYVATWNAEKVPSGVYFYRLTAGNFIETKKMVLMK